MGVPPSSVLSASGGRLPAGKPDESRGFSSGSSLIELRSISERYGVKTKRLVNYREIDVKILTFPRYNVCEA